MSARGVLSRVAVGPSQDRGVSGSGQATVEFSLVVLLLLVAFLAIVDFGRMVAMHSAIVTASREAARYGSATKDSGSGPQYIDCAGIRDAARRVIGGLVTLPDSAIEISYDDGPKYADGSGDAPTAACGVGAGPQKDEILRLHRVVVKVTATYRPIAPLVQALVPPIQVVSLDRRSIVKGP